MSVWDEEGVKLYPLKVEVTDDVPDDAALEEKPDGSVNAYDETGEKVGEENGIMKRQRSKNGRCLLCNITKTDQIHDADRNLCDDNMYKKEENYFSAICFNRRMISSF